MIVNHDPAPTYLGLLPTVDRIRVERSLSCRGARPVRPGGHAWSARISTARASRASIAAPSSTSTTTARTRRYGEVNYARRARPGGGRDGLALYRRGRRATVARGGDQRLSSPCPPTPATSASPTPPAARSAPPPRWSTPAPPRPQVAALGPRVAAAPRRSASWARRSRPSRFGERRRARDHGRRPGRLPPRRGSDAAGHARTSSTCRGLSPACGPWRSSSSGSRAWSGSACARRGASTSAASPRRFGGGGHTNAAGCTCAATSTQRAPT